ncbi:MAG: DNA polymerase III subunit delta [Candidatus Uhrbacteria bacterium]
MIILVYGDDSFRVQEKVTELKKAFSKKFDPAGYNLTIFPDPKTGKNDPNEIIRSAVSFPFMSEKRLVIARDLAAGNKKDLDWAEGLNKIPASTIFIFWETLEPKELERKPLFKKLQEISEVHFYPFPKLEGVALSKWTTGRIIEYGGTATPDALRALLERVGDDLWQIDGEIQKLVAYADGVQITKDMVEKLVRATFDSQIFSLMDAVSSRRAAEVIKLLEDERASGAADGYVFSMLLRQIRILLGARLILEDNPRANKDQIATELDIHPFVASKALPQARAFSADELRRSYELLYQLDLGMKSGKYSDKLAVDLMVATLVV